MTDSEFQARLDCLARLVAGDMESFLAHCGLGGGAMASSCGGRTFTGPCPVHGGDNPTAFQIYVNREDEDDDGRLAPVVWKCYTSRCHERFGSNVFGLVRGIFSCTFSEALSSLLALCRAGSLKELPAPGPQELELRAFVSQASVMARGSKRPTPLSLSRQEVRARLRVPSLYFQARGFSPDILDRFDAGDCLSHGKPMSGRAVVPVYDDDGRWAVGFTGRSVHPECPSCGLYHDRQRQGCDSARAGPVADYIKWRHTGDFPKEFCLFAWHLARKEAAKKGRIILVESPANVMRLHEAGFSEACGLFGSSLSDPQKVLLETSGALEIVLALDNDPAGRSGSDAAKRKLRRLFNVREAFPPDPYKDWGEIPAGETKSFEELLR